MDVARYIGLFLLKNHFCYIHGLGNLELRRKPATYDGTALHPSVYEIMVTPTGSIDDTLANYIATNEQISISKAANALRDYTTQSRADLQKGIDVHIPYIGKFVEENGKVKFVTDRDFQYAPGAIPAVRINRKMSDAPYQASNNDQNNNQSTLLNENRQETVLEEEPPKRIKRVKQEQQEGKVNWTRVALAVAVLLALSAGTFYGYKYYKKKKNNTQNAAAVFEDTTMHQPKVDTAQVKRDSAAVASMNGGDSGTKEFKIIIDSYDKRAQADKRAKQMQSYGHNVVVVAEDSSSYLIIMPVNCAPRDTNKVMDSLSSLYNPAGVSIYE